MLKDKAELSVMPPFNPPQPQPQWEEGLCKFFEWNSVGYNQMRDFIRNLLLQQREEIKKWAEEREWKEANYPETKLIASGYNQALSDLIKYLQ